jgi:hypothetical protein
MIPGPLPLSPQILVDQKELLQLFFGLPPPDLHGKHGLTGTCNFFKLANEAL